jgi:hypothetical protein
MADRDLRVQESPEGGNEPTGTDGPGGSAPPSGGGGGDGSHGDGSDRLPGADDTPPSEIEDTDDLPPTEADGDVDVPPGGGGGGGGGGLFGDVGDALGDAADDVEDAVDDAADDAEDAAEDAYDDASDAAGKALDDTEVAGGKAYEDTKEWWDEDGGEDLAIGASETLGAIINTPFQLADEAEHGLRDIDEDLAEVQDEFQTYVADPLNEKADHIGDQAGKLWDETADRAGREWDNLQDTPGQIAHDPLGTLDDGGQRLADNVADASWATESTIYGGVVDGLDEANRLGDDLRPIVDPVAETLDLPNIKDGDAWNELGDGLAPAYDPVEDIVNDLPGGLRDANEDFNTGVRGTQGVLGDLNDGATDQFENANDTVQEGLSPVYHNPVGEVIGDEYYGEGVIGDVLYGDGLADAYESGREVVDDAGDSLDGSGGGGDGSGGDESGTPSEPTDPLDHIGDTPWDATYEVAELAGEEGAQEALADADGAVSPVEPVEVPGPTVPLDDLSEGLDL